MRHSNEPADRRFSKLAGLMLIPAGAVLYGALFYQYVTSSPLAGVPVLDAQYYYRLAVDAAILGKGWPPVFFSAPLYPVLLTSEVFITGGGLEGLYLIGLVTCIASVCLIAATASKALSAHHGAVAGWLALLYFPLAFTGLKLLPESISIFLLAFFLYVAVGANQASKLARFCIMGFAGGLLVLARTQAAPIAGIVICAIPWTAGPFADKKRAAAACIAAAACAALPVAAWGGVNLYRTGEFFLFPPNGGITFYQGNNPRSNGTYAPVPGIGDDVNRQLAEMTSLVSRETGRNVTPKEADGYFWKQGLSFIKAHPADWLSLELKKAILSLDVREPGLIYDQYLEESLHLPASKFFPVNWSMLVALAIIGLADVAFFNRKKFRRLFPLIVAVCFFGGMLLVFYVSSRYRILLLCPVAVLASHGVAASAGWAKNRRFAPLAFAGLLAAAAVWRSIAFNPEISPGALNNLAYAYIVKGDYAQAEKICRMVLAKNPADAVAARNLSVSIDLGRK